MKYLCPVPLSLDIGLLRNRGKGIITRYVSALMDYKIANLNIERFVIKCAMTNLRSRAAAEQLGHRLHVAQPNEEVVGEFVYG